MTDADLQADLDAIKTITARWLFPETTFVLVVLPQALAAEKEMIVQSNFEHVDIPNILRAVADDVEEGEPGETFASGRPQ